MNDESCGCPCRECREQDNHRCGLETCGYTKHLRRRTSPKPAPKLVGDELAIVRDQLGIEFKRIKDPAKRARLLEWGKLVAETQHMDVDTRKEKRDEKFRELFG